MFPAVFIRRRRRGPSEPMPDGVGVLVTVALFALVLWGLVDWCDL
jgi:hypothetical protein